MSVQLVTVDGAQLEVLECGSGEPIVFVQTALTADELLPVAQAPALEHGYHKIIYHRRGYAGSSAVSGPGSIARDAADCRALLVRSTSTARMSSGCPTAPRSVCSWRGRHRSSSTASSWWSRRRCTLPAPPRFVQPTSV